IDEEEEIPETPAGEITSANGADRFEHGQFGYADTLLMKDLNIDVKPGQTVAIDGLTGAGKTTMINLLMRCYEVNSEAIKLDNQDIESMSRHDIRAHIGMVRHDTWLYNGMIRENIEYYKNNAVEKEEMQSA